MLAGIKKSLKKNYKILPKYYFKVGFEPRTNLKLSFFYIAEWSLLQLSWILKIKSKNMIFYFMWLEPSKGKHPL